MLSHLDLVAFDMHQHLGVDLLDVFATRSWRWFADQVGLLLTLDQHVATFHGVVTVPATRLGMFFHHDPDEEPADE